MSPFAGQGMKDAACFQDTDDGAEAPSAAPLALGLSGFGPGVMIDTSEGPQPAEWLRSGDLIRTRDHGYQPLKWVGRSPTHPASAPVRIFAGTLGHNLPEHDLIVAGDQHVLIRAAEIELLFAQEEVLAPVRGIATEAETAGQNAKEGAVLCHLLFDRHEIILAEGVWLESLCLNDDSLAQLPARERDNLLRQVTASNLDMQSARMVLTGDEAALCRPRSAVALKRMAA